MGDKSGKTDNNPHPEQGHSGLDINGQMRIGDNLTLAVSGDEVELRQAHTGRVVKVAEATLAADLIEKYMPVEHVK